MGSNPYPKGTPEWQQWMNEEIARHDAEQKKRDEAIDAQLKKQAQEAARKAAEEEARRKKNGK